MARSFPFSQAESRGCASPSRSPPGGSAFDRKPAQEKPWTEKLWIYDLRTNKHFTLKENTLQRANLNNFVKCYFGNAALVGRAVPSAPKSAKKEADGAVGTQRPTGSRYHRVEMERLRAFIYEDLLRRDKINLNIFWLKDESLEAALEKFSEISDDLKG